MNEFAPTTKIISRKKKTFCHFGYNAEKKMHYPKENEIIKVMQFTNFVYLRMRKIYMLIFIFGKAETTNKQTNKQTPENQ